MCIRDSFVPLSERGKGYGRKVVEGLLAEARENGAHKAILFAAGETASKIYESIGFERIGDYRVALFETPEKVPAQ